MHYFDTESHDASALVLCSVDYGGLKNNLITIIKT